MDLAITALEALQSCSLFLVLTPRQLVSRLATLVTSPRVHEIRYHGLFAPYSKERSRIVPATVPEPATTSAPSPSDQPHSQAAKTLRTYRISWALLLRKVFAWDVLRCPDCGGTMQVLAVIADTAA